MEAKRTFNIAVTLPGGNVVTKPVYACTHWHAMELLYPSMMDQQPNRACYRLIRKKRVQVR